MSTVYLNDIGTLFAIDTQDDISTNNSIVLRYKKPNGVKGNWSPTLNADNQTVEYVTVDGDLDQLGEWELQVYVDLPAWKGHSDIVTFTVEKPINA